MEFFADDEFKPGIHNTAVVEENAIIGKNVFVGANAFILPGIKIHDYAIIGAASVVTKNVGKYEIVGGNPAKFIKKRVLK